ncbi:MAG: hypothetical protein HYY04_10815, partial [Chloroflexi bacterium]|nr:hypothetical protein [Chloroflexota bacterium]
MLLTDLANAFRKIEATTKRHQMTALLADLFRSGPEDAAILPYLLQGRLGPPYAAPDIGADEHRIAQAIAEATGVAEPEVWRLYRERGDLGLVAEELLPSTGQPITVRETYHQLRAIATAAGAGAYEEKVRRLRDLLQRLSGPEARYLVRIAQGRLRLGVGDATVMDALSLACFPHPFPSPRREEGGQARGPAPTLPASSPLSRAAGEGVGGED